jgi:prepilin-type N-terminal cleavage/methylation domain-containing protein
MTKTHLEKKQARGFTLIELLVVISIIGFMSSVVLGSLNVARMKARNARRISDMTQIQKALELYAFDNSGTYPTTSSGFRSQCSTWGTYAANNVIPGLVPTYLPSMPQDPSTSGVTSACYVYISDGASYKILDYDIAPREISSFSYLTYPAFINPVRDSGSNYCLVDYPSGATNGNFAEWAIMGGVLNPCSMPTPSVPYAW